MDKQHKLKHCAKNRPINNWEFDPNEVKELHTNELTFGRIKAFLYQNIHKSLTKHDLIRCFNLLKVSVRETTLDPYVTFRFIMILIESNWTNDIDRNVLIHSERLINHLNLSKPDVFCEYLSYYIRHDRIEDAKEHYDLRHRQMHSGSNRKLPYINTYLKSYEMLFNYTQWSSKISSDRILPEFDRSTQGWIINAMNYLTQAQGNYEYFVMCVVNVLLNYGYLVKAYLLASEFQRKNLDNLSAHLILLYLIRKIYLDSVSCKQDDIIKDRKFLPLAKEVTKVTEFTNRTDELLNLNNFTEITDCDRLDYESFSIITDENESLAGLRRLDPSCSEMMHFTMKQDNSIETMRYLMDGLEDTSQMSDMIRWKELHRTLKQIFASQNEVVILDAQHWWHIRYKRYWASLDLEKLIGNNLTNKDIKLLRKIIKIFRDKSRWGTRRSICPISATQSTPSQ